MNYKEFLRKTMERNEQKVQEFISKERQEEISKLSKNSGIPRRFDRASFGNFNPKYNQVAVNKANNFVEDFPRGKGLLLSGPVGTGKTHIAISIANELLNKFYSVYFGNVIDIMNFIKSTYSKNSSISEDEAIALMTEKVDLFIIDDLGKENSTEYTLSMLYQLINRVYENEKSIVITTNYSSNNLSRKLGERGQAIVSRIAEMCDPVLFRGEDWRVRK